MLETTGLADPAPVLQTAMAHPYLVMRYRLDGVITVVDAINGGATLDEHLESVKQAAVADRIVLTKTDLIDTPERRQAKADLLGRLKALNPAARVLDAQAGEATPEKLLDCGLYDPAQKTADVRRWLAEEAYAAPHDHHGTTTTIRTATTTASAPSRSRPTHRSPARPSRCSSTCLRSLHGPKLLRLKGVVQIAETPDEPVVIHGVQHVMHPPVRLERWPDGDRRTRIVLIVRDLAPQEVTRLFDAFMNRSAPDQPRSCRLARQPVDALRRPRSLTLPALATICRVSDDSTR